jgi:hypothetical protein
MEAQPVNSTSTAHRVAAAILSGEGRAAVTLVADDPQARDHQQPAEGGRQAALRPALKDVEKVVTT